MSTKKRIIRESLGKMFARRNKSGHAGALRPQDALLFDTISVQAILALRGQNPFPEEEGEVCSLYPRILERPLFMR
jgi:hypothetical protein